MPFAPTTSRLFIENLGNTVRTEPSIFCSSSTSPAPCPDTHAHDNRCESNAFHNDIGKCFRNASSTFPSHPSSVSFPTYPCSTSSEPRLGVIMSKYPYLLPAYWASCWEDEWERSSDAPANDVCSLCTHVVFRTVCSTLHVSTAGISLDRELRLVRRLSSSTTCLSVASLINVRKLIRSSRVRSHADVVATFFGIPHPWATMLS